MDAIPYLSKDIGTNAENQPKTHAIIRLLSSYIQLTAPSSVIQVEACQSPKDKTLKITQKAQIAKRFVLLYVYNTNILGGTLRLGGEELEYNNNDNYYEIRKVKITDIDNYDILPENKELIRKAYTANKKEN